MTTNQIEILKLWVSDLRANPDKQGKHRLTSIDYNGVETDCCLGRLCKLAVKEKIVEATIELVASEKIDTQIRYISTFGNSTKTLPHSVREWAGLNEVNPRVYIGNSKTTLADLNDGSSDGGVTRAPYTFAQIADIIEKQIIIPAQEKIVNQN